MNKEPLHRTGCDGVKRLIKEENRLNQLAVAAFTSGAGKEFLEYLRSITIESVGGPAISNDHLRHLEGARWVVGIMETRRLLGNKERENATGER